MAKTKYTYNWAEGNNDFAALTQDNPNQYAFEMYVRKAENYGLGAIVTALSHSNWDFANKVCDVWFHGPLSASDKAVLDAVVAAHTGEPMNTTSVVRIEQSDEFGRLRTIPEAPIGTELDTATHNFSDKTTWADCSIKVTDAAMEDAGTGEVFRFMDAGEHRTFIIKPNHGRVLKECCVHPDKVAVIKVGNMTLTKEKLPWTSEGSDWEYEIDHRAGTVRFKTPRIGETITATYHYAGESWWMLKPPAGKAIIIQEAEVQFSSDVNMLDRVVMRAMVRIAPDTIVPLSSIDPEHEDTEYDTMEQMIMEAKGSYPVIPAIGGPTRGLKQSVYGFPFAYLTSRDLPQDTVELWVGLEGHNEFGGFHSSATFYSRVVDV